LNGVNHFRDVWLRYSSAVIWKRIVPILPWVKREHDMGDESGVAVCRDVNSAKLAALFRVTLLLAEPWPAPVVMR